MEHRQQAITNRNSMTASAGEKNPMLDQIMSEPGDSQAQTLYRRQTTSEVHFGFDDFQMINIIGKGTFGKVFSISLKYYIGISRPKQTYEAALCHEEHSQGHCP